MDKNKRTKFIVFLLVGFVIFLTAWLLNLYADKIGEKQAEFWSDLLVNVCATFLGVALIGFIWNFVGGEPLEKIVQELKRAVGISKQFDRMGIVTYWLERSEQENDRKKEYLQQIPKSKEIDVMGLTLTHMFDDSNVRTALYEVIQNKDAQIRILISHPDMSNAVTNQRANTQSERNEKVFKGYLDIAFKGLKNLYNDLKKIEKERNLQVKVAHKHVLYCMVVRMDDEMFVCNYFSTLVGNETPTMHICNKGDDSLFAKYHKEFRTSYEEAIYYNFEE